MACTDDCPTAQIKFVKIRTLIRWDDDLTFCNPVKQPSNAAGTSGQLIKMSQFGSPVDQYVRGILEISGITPTLVMEEYLAGVVPVILAHGQAKL